MLASALLHIVSTLFPLNRLLRFHSRGFLMSAEKSNLAAINFEHVSSEQQKGFRGTLLTQKELNWQEYPVESQGTLLNPQ
jgi:hypothetical protein